MATENQALADLPTWLLILVALAGLVGEMRQADVPGVALGEILRRVVLRFGSSAGQGEGQRRADHPPGPRYVATAHATMTTASTITMAPRARSPVMRPPGA